MYAIWTRQDTTAGCIMQLPECIQWKQLSPAENVEETDDIQGAFYIHLTDFSGDVTVRKRFIDENPEWLKLQNDKERYLALRVWLDLGHAPSQLATDREDGLRFQQLPYSLV